MCLSDEIWTLLLLSKTPTLFSGIGNLRCSKGAQSSLALCLVARLRRIETFPASFTRNTSFVLLLNSSRKWCFVCSFPVFDKGRTGRCLPSYALLVERVDMQPIIIFCNTSAVPTGLALMEQVCCSFRLQVFRDEVSLNTGR